MSFLTPLFLLGLLGLLVPWLLHRLQEQKASATDFPSTRFLQSTRTSTERRRKLRYKGLLFLRALALFLLCLSFAQPFLSDTDDENTDSDKLHVLVLDRSLSMSVEGRWEMALETAERVLDEIPATDRVKLFSASRALTSQPGNTRDEILLSVKALRPDQARLDYTTMMEQLHQYSEQQKQAVVVHLVTDLQKSAAPLNLNTLRSNSFDQLLIHSVVIGEQKNVSVHGSAAWSGPGRAVVSVDLFHSVGKNPTEIKPQDDPDKPKANIKGQLKVARSEGQNSVMLVDTEVEIPTDGDRTIVLDDLDVPERGENNRVNLTVSFVPADNAQNNLTADDTVNLALSLDGVATVKLVSTSSSPEQRERIYLETALAQKKNTLVEFSSIDDNVDFTSTDIVVFLAPGDEYSTAGGTAGLASSQSSGQSTGPSSGKLSAEAAIPTKLIEFIVNGGSALIVLGSSGGANLPPGFSATGTRSDAFTANQDYLGDRVDTISRVSTSHPLALEERGWSEVSIYNPAVLSVSQAVAQESTQAIDQSQGGILTPLWLSDLEKKLDPTTAPAVLLSSNTNAPVLLELMTNSGQVLVLGLPLDGISNDLPLSPVFVPFLLSLVDYLKSGNSYPELVHVGDAIKLPVSAQLLSPDGSPMRDLSARQEAKPLVLPETGIYTVIDETGESLIHVISDPRESRAESLAPELVVAWQANSSKKSAEEIVGLAPGSEGGSESGSAIVSGSAAEVDAIQTTDSLFESNDRQTLWKLLLPLLVLIGLFEMFCGNWYLQRFGKAA